MQSIVIVALIIGFVSGRQDDERTWSDSTGKFTVVAKLLSNKNGKVTLEKQDGTSVEVPLARLSSADRKYLRELTRAKYSKDQTAENAVDETTDETSPVSATLSWPSWRGPERNGVSTESDLLQAWPEEGPKVIWKSDGMGAGFSSVAVADKKLFTMGRENGKQHVICVSLQGDPLWKTAISRDGEPNCTPTYDDGRVYALGRHGTLACLNAENGQLVWSVDFAKDFGGKMMSGWGYSESPLVDGDRLICTPGSPDAMIIALNKKDGSVIWKTPMQNGGSRGQDGAGYASVVISNGGGIKQYITLVGRGLISVNAETGRPMWQYEKIANGTANVPTPIVEGDYVFCSSGYGDGGSALLKLARSAAGVQYQEIYYYPADQVQNHHGGMVLVDGHIYMGHGHNQGFPLCLEMTTGKIKWGAPKIRGAGNGSAAIVAADGQLYFRYEDGRMGLVEINPRQYKLNGSFRLPVKNGKSWPHPVVCDGRLYIRDQQELVCFDIQSR